jgi:hypothetical protein
MRRKEAVERLQASLASHIQKWFIEINEGRNPILVEAVTSMGWIGEKMHELMAKSAIAVYEASGDTEDYLRKEKMLAK